MANIRLENPTLILMPISEAEKAECEERFMGDEDIYVLYKLSDSKDIQIGMMSSSMRKYFPSTANVWRLDDAVSKAYFYNGAAQLEKAAMSITDRPVYRIRPSDSRTVNGYDVLNGTYENGLRIWLEDIVDGIYTLEQEEANQLRR